MKVDLHNHTYLCNHAKGEMKDYVETAIKNKTKYFGFSDHAPLNPDDGYRMKFEDMDFYEKEVKKLKDIYQDKIEILLGYEVDFIAGHLDDRVINSNVDYLIGSIHYLKRWNFDNPEYISEYKNKDIDKIWEDYFKAVEDMAKTGLFQIAGHLDLIKVFNFKPKKDVRKIAKEAIKAIKRANMVVEINASGLRKPVKEIYPSNELLELIKEYDIDITLSSDAHEPSQVGKYSKEIENVLKKFEFDKCAIFRNREKSLIKI